MKTPRSHAGAFLLFLAGSVSADVYVGEPPPELWGSSKDRVAVSMTGFTGLIRYETSGKTISIEWRQKLSDSVYTTHRGVQELALPFWPTDVVRIAPLRFCVAGKKRNGATVIQEFALGHPVLTTDLEGNARVHAPVTSIETIYDEVAEGRDMVTHMFLDLASGTDLFVQFWDSNDVYHLDPATGLLTIAFSAIPLQGTPDTAELAKPFRRSFGGREHATLGFVYGLHSPDQPSLNCLLLVDSDRNGVLDTSMVLTPQEWKDLGMSDGANYDD